MHWDSDSIALALASAVAASLVRAGDARADGSAADSSYGRVDGDVALVGGAGAVATGRGVRAEVELRLRYLESAGVYVTYEDAVAVGSAADPQRVLCTGLELRPLFLLRWLRGNETQRARLDLALDSIGLEMGATFHQPVESGLASQPGIEVGLGFEFPVLERASGPWIGVRGALRWSDAALASGVVSGSDDRQAVLTLTLAWHQIVSAHVVDLGDRVGR